MLDKKKKINQIKIPADPAGSLAGQKKENKSNKNTTRVTCGARTEPIFPHSEPKPVPEFRTTVGKNSAE